MHTPEHNDTRALIADMDALAHALGVSECAPELQLQIINAWSELLFKRLLLRIPEEHTADVRALIASTETSDTAEGDVIAQLLAYIPDADTTLAEEVSRTIAEFRTSDAA